MNNDMKLPEDKMCVDCVNFRRCHGLFQCNLRNTECDWSPSRFVHKTMSDILSEVEEVVVALSI